MGEALYEYTGKGKKRKKGERLAQRSFTAADKANMAWVKKMKAYRNAKTVAEKAAVMKKAGFLGRGNKALLSRYGEVSNLSASGVRRGGTRGPLRNKKGGVINLRPTSRKASKKVATSRRARKAAPAKGRRVGALGAEKRR